MSKAISAANARRWAALSKQDRSKAMSALAKLKHSKKTKKERREEMMKLTRARIKKSKS